MGGWMPHVCVDGDVLLGLPVLKNDASSGAGLRYAHLYQIHALLRL